MQLLITGSTGFLGRYVVAEALERGHQVRAVVRPASELAHLDWIDHPQVELIRTDLRRPTGLAEMIRGVDAVLHLAADKTADFYGQFAANVVATEHLLDAVQQAQIKRFIAISSFSVYNFLTMPSRSVLDESSPLERNPAVRDEYGQTKLIQERLIRDHSAKHNLELTVLRPGVIYGKDHLFNARLGIAAGKALWIRIGAYARLPLSYVENCAEAVVRAAESTQAIGQTINIVDDNLPTQRKYAAMLQQRITPRPRIVPVAWTVMRSLARCAWITDKVLFGGQAKVPGMLVPARLHARAKPMRYSNERLKLILGWKPRFGLSEALDRSLNVSPL